MSLLSLYPPPPFQESRDELSHVCHIVLRIALYAVNLCWSILLTYYSHDLWPWEAPISAWDLLEPQIKNVRNIALWYFF